MKAIIEVPVEVLENNPDTGLGAMLVKIPDVSIERHKTKLAIVYRLEGEVSVVNPVVSHLMTLIYTERRKK